MNSTSSPAPTFRRHPRRAAQAAATVARRDRDGLAAAGGAVDADPAVSVRDGAIRLLVDERSVRGPRRASRSSTSTMPETAAGSPSPHNASRRGDSFLAVAQIREHLSPTRAFAHPRAPAARTRRDARRARPHFAFGRAAGYLLDGYGARGFCAGRLAPRRGCARRTAHRRHVT